MSKISEAYEDGMLDITGCADLQIMLSDHSTGVVLHVTTPDGTRLRICRIIGDIEIIDNRKATRHARIQAQAAS